MGWIIALGCCVAVLLALAVFYALSLSTNKGRKQEMKPLEAQYIAHRGFFDNNGDAPENSLKAFARAVEHGYGMELDVQLTKDGRLVVFHDGTMKRMCGVDKRVDEFAYDELCAYKLASSQERIPLFEDVLCLVAGKRPLIVEIKAFKDWKETTEKTANLLDGYDGYYVIESFDPRVVAWYKKHRPQVIRGQLSTNYFKDRHPMGWFRKFLMTNLLTNFMTRPDFIAYNHRDKNEFSYRLCRKLNDVENVAWTVRSQQELESAKGIYQVFIFDSFVPDAE